MKFPFLTVKMETTLLNNFNEDVINEITITMAIVLNDYLKEIQKSIGDNEGVL